MRLTALTAIAVLVVAAPAAADELDLPPLGMPGDRACDVAPPPPPAARAAQAPNVRATITRYERRGFISEADADAFRAVYADALAARRRLGGQRRGELSAVIGQLESFARRGELTASRLPILFFQLRRNTQQ